MRKAIQCSSNNSGSITGLAHLTKDTYTLEVSTEVCNKVGGIYTVLKTKAATFTRQFNSHYLLIGPILPNVEYVELDTSSCGNPPDKFARTKEKLESKGIQVKLGRWKVDGRPWTVLLGFQTPLDEQRNQDLRCVIEQHWDVKYPKKTLNEQERADINFYMQFGLLVTRFIDEFICRSEEKPQTVCLFHEWTSSFALALLSMMKIRVATVFITHATVLGRRMCESGSDFYQIVDKINPKKEAERLHVTHLHQIEKRVVASADIVTTVSSITSEEIAKLHNRHPDIITPNGLHVALSVKDGHSVNRKKIDEFVRRHFFQNLRFNETKIIYTFSAGRLEFKNKGIDVYIEALSRLNANLIAVEANITLVAFLVFPSRTYDLNDATIKRHKDYEYRRRSVTRLTGITNEKTLDAIMFGGEEFMLDKKLITRENCKELKEIFKHTYYPPEKNPPITTHNMANDNDAIIQSLKRYRLLNCYRDRVKVVYHAEFLTKENPLFSLDYQEFVSGCDIGVFASYYEPWGYTPAECHIQGTPAITSDLSGYGGFLKTIQPSGVDQEQMGIYVVERLKKTPNQSIDQLAEMLERFMKQSVEKRRVQREKCISVGKHSDWKTLCQSYYQAMNMAIEKQKKAEPPPPSNPIIFIKKPSLTEESVAPTLRAKENDRRIIKRALTSAF